LDIRINSGCGSGDYLGIEIQVAFENEEEAEKLRINIPKWARLWTQLESLVQYREKHNEKIDISLQHETFLLRSLLRDSTKWGDQYGL